MDRSWTTWMEGAWIVGSTVEEGRLRLALGARRPDRTEPRATGTVCCIPTSMERDLWALRFENACGLSVSLRTWRPALRPCVKEDQPFLGTRLPQEQKLAWFLLIQ